MKKWTANSKKMQDWENPARDKTREWKGKTHDVWIQPIHPSKNTIIKRV